MHSHSKPALLLATFALLAAAGPTQAADAFTWRPQALGLNGGGFVADTLVLGDTAQITFGAGAGGATFVDRGFMPVLGFTLQGEPVRTPGINAPLSAGWGAYIDYIARGTQVFSPAGVPVSATFEQLDYSLVAYNGAATFALDGATGAPTVGGERRGTVTLAAGSLVSGELSFVPGPTGLGIAGVASTTAAGVPTAFSDAPFTGLDVSFVHPPEEYVFRPDLGAILIPGGGSSSSAAIRLGTGGGLVEGTSPTEGVAVPEPATALLVGAGLLGLGLARRRSRDAVTCGGRGGRPCHA